MAPGGRGRTVYWSGQRGKSSTSTFLAVRPLVETTGGAALLLWRLSTHSDPVALADLRRKVRDAMSEAGLRADAVVEMEVAVGEALSNVYRHAYEYGVGPISVAVYRYPAQVSVVITDRGNATKVPEVLRGWPPRTSERGRGLYLVGRLADEVRIRVNRTGYGLTVRLTKRLRPPEVAGGNDQAA